MKDLGEWKARLPRTRIEPPEATPRPRELAPGFVPFMYRLGLTPRHPERLFDWRTLMTTSRERERSQERIELFRLMRRALNPFGRTK